MIKTQLSLIPDLSEKFSNIETMLFFEYWKNINYLSGSDYYIDTTVYDSEQLVIDFLKEYLDQLISNYDKSDYFLNLILDNFKEKIDFSQIAKILTDY